MAKRPRSRKEIYAMAQLRISWFKSLKHPPSDPKYASILLEKHFMHVDRLIDIDIA